MKKIALSMLLFLISSTLWASSQASPASRSITVNNHCSFDVDLFSVGSNASAIPCTATATNAQANCPSDFVCYQKSSTTSYCVAGTANSGAPIPLTQTADITLSAACPGNTGTPISNAGNSWGQCGCNTDSECPSGQACQTVSGSTKQCFWNLNLSNGGKIPAKTATKVSQSSVSLAIGSSRDSSTVASGKFYAKLACDVNGNCLSDNTKGAPATLVEYTFTDANDWYDVSYINGVNVPATMYPTPATNLAYGANSPYSCTAAGGDATTLTAISAYQAKNNISGNTSLKNFACSNDFSTTFDTATLSGFNFISKVAGATSCTSSSDCGTGLSCGLTLGDVNSGATATSCGNRLGYWTYAQFCAVNSSYSNTDLGIACNDTQVLGYALCEDQTYKKLDKKGKEITVTQTGPGLSCFNGNTTVSGDECCGYKHWEITTKNKKGKKTTSQQPMAGGFKTIDGVVTTEWTQNILPAVSYIKDNCHLAYAYQYDDPFSTFTCNTTGSAANSASYTVDLCAEGDAGIAPPGVSACSPQVPSGLKDSYISMGTPSGISIAMTEQACTKNCTLSPISSGSSIYNVSSTQAGTYDIAATKCTQYSAGKKKGDKKICTKSVVQTCSFDIPSTQCVSRSSGNPAYCENWGVSTTSPWTGRSISIPDFN